MPFLRKSQIPPFRLLAAPLLGSVVLFLAACSHVKVTNPRPEVELTPAPYFDSPTGIYFPGSLGPLVRQPVIHLENRNPGLGVAVTYRNDEARIDVFVYDLQASLIPVGIDSDVIRQSFDDALADLEKAANRRLYRDLDIQQTGVTRIGTTDFLHARFSYGEDMLLKDGQLLVAGVNSQILKIRTALNRNASLEIERLLFFLGQSVEQSRRNGYGGISSDQYEAISRSLGAIDLSGGLTREDAIAIAQMELVNQERHNRFDPTSATLARDALPDSATIRFAHYPTVPSLPFTGQLEVQVNRFGEATLIEEDTS